MILSDSNFSEKQLTIDGVTSPRFMSFNNLYFYKFNKIYSTPPFGTMTPDIQINAKGNLDNANTKNFICYYISACGTKAWDGKMVKKTVTGPIVSTDKMFTTPDYNYTDEDLNKWLKWLSINATKNGSIINGSSPMNVTPETTSGKCIFYVEHNKDFMSDFFTDFPPYNKIMPSKIENGIIDGMFQPFIPTSGNTDIIFSYDNLQYYLGTQATSERSNFVCPTTQAISYEGFDNDAELNAQALDNLEQLQYQPYSCNIWDANQLTNIGCPRGSVEQNTNYTTYYYKPLLGYPIYIVNWTRISNLRKSIDNKLAESSCWWVSMAKMEAGFFNDPSINI